MANNLPKYTVTAGPTEVSSRVLRAISQQTLYHYDPVFLERYRDTTEKLKLVFQTKNDIIIMHGEVILGLEGAAKSLVEAGDKCLNLATGPFGKGYGRHFLAVGGEMFEIEVPFNQVIDPADVRKMFEEHPDIKVVAMAHCETPAGTVNPVKEICAIAKEYGAITIVDAVSSVGGIDLKVDEWGVDVCVVGPQKCLGATPGSALVSVSDAAWNKMKSNKKPLRGSILSMLDQKERWLDGGRFPYTPMVNQMASVNEAVTQLLEEGLENSFARHHAAAVACREGIKAMGLKLWPVSEEICSDCATAVTMPEGLTEQILSDLLRDKYGVMISGGHGALVDKVFRIGHLGYTANLNHVMAALMALEEALTELGVEIKVGAGAAAALAAWQAETSK